MKPAPPVTTMRKTAESGKMRTLAQMSGGCSRLIVTGRTDGGSPKDFVISKCTISFNCFILIGNDCDDSIGGAYLRYINVINKNEIGTIHICSVIHILNDLI